MANKPQLQLSRPWPLWRYRSPQDVSAEHGRWPWWQPMKIPWSCDRLTDETCFAFGKTIWKCTRVISFTLWAVYKLNLILNLIRISDWSVHSEFPFHWDLCSEYRQLTAQVGGAYIYSLQLGPSNWLTATASRNLPLLYRPMTCVIFEAKGFY